MNLNSVTKSLLAPFCLLPIAPLKSEMWHYDIESEGLVVHYPKTVLWPGPSIEYHLSARGGGSRLWSQGPRVKEEGLLWIWSQPGQQGESLSRKQNTQKQWLIILFFSPETTYKIGSLPAWIELRLTGLAARAFARWAFSPVRNNCFFHCHAVAQVVWSLRLVKILADVMVVILTWLSTVWSWSMIDFFFFCIF